MNKYDLDKRREYIILCDKLQEKQKRKKRVSRAVSRELKRDISSCEECGSDVKLQVHHINKDSKDNRIENLQKLCLYCHMKKHEGEPVRRLMNKQLKSIG